MITTELKDAFDLYYGSGSLTDTQLAALIAYTDPIVKSAWVLPQQFDLFAAEFRAINADCHKLKLIRADRGKIDESARPP